MLSGLWVQEGQGIEMWIQYPGGHALYHIDSEMCRRRCNQVVRYEFGPDIS